MVQIELLDESPSSKIKRKTGEEEGKEMQAPNTVSRQRGDSEAEVEGEETLRGKVTEEGEVDSPSSHQNKLCTHLGRRVGKGRSNKDRSWLSRARKSSLTISWWNI